MELSEVSLPVINENQVLVKNHYSIISTGTEGKTVKDARMSYVGKAKARQKEVKQVIDMAKSQGLKETYRMVMNKLEALAPLGYSCAGEVIDVGDDIVDFKPGDLVACGGAGAYHAEIVAVHKHLCAKVPSGVDMRHAAFTTVAAIAMQGIRQAELKLGENAAVIGLGLVGQLTVQMLNAAGVQTYAIDIDSNPVKLAKDCGATLAIERNRDDLTDIIIRQTHGYGTDAVIITAGTSSLDPVELAGVLCRKKGKIVIVGAVPTGFSRPNYYKKELDLRMSSSYGPGRYDPVYEEKGIDYPYGYVRWTENRNMQAYLQLLQDKKLQIDKLITHEFKFEEAPQAYQMIVDKSEPFTGIMIKYGTSNTDLTRKISFSENSANQTNKGNVGFIGAGSFAQNMLLPHIKHMGNLVGVATANGHTSRYVAEKYGFHYATTEADEIFEDKNIDTVFIATRHNLHAPFVVKALQSGKNVFVEKPLAMDETSLEEIKTVYEAMTPEKRPRLMVGFNRRFAPHIETIRNVFGNELPKAVQYRINAGMVAADHWIHDPEIGGGRIIGEVCHFIDLAMYLAGSDIASLSAKNLDDDKNLMDTLVVSLAFVNGSVAGISYFSNGSKCMPKEYLEVFAGSQAAVLNDFRELVLYAHKEKQSKQKQDKGHRQGVTAFLDSVKEGKPAPISFDALYHSTLATLKVIESIKTGATLSLNG